MKILIVEDDDSLCRLLKATLTEQRYVVSTATDGQTGWELSQTSDYDLILLDVMLPQLDGVTFCRRLRAIGSQVLILLMTAKGSSDDKAMGLDAGADDYVVKPVELRELEARIRALLRRRTATQSPVLEWGALRLDPSSCKVTYGDTLLNLTAKEYGLLELFLGNQQRIYSQSAILDQLWTDDQPGEDTVRVHIRRLRQKLKSVGAADLIETVYGLGYRLNAAFQAATTAVITPQSTDSALSTDSLLVPLESERLKLIERLTTLEQAVQTLLSSLPDPTVRQQAKRDSHQLSGSLAMLGFPEGTETMQRLERLLYQPHADRVALQTELAALQQLIKTASQQPGQSQSLQAGTNAPPPFSDANSQQQAALPPHVLLVSEDSTFTEPLITTQITAKLQAVIAPTPSLARDAISRIRPDVVLLDLSTQALPEAFDLLAELADSTPPIPTLVFTTPPQPINRIALARSRNRYLLQKPMATDRVLNLIHQVLARPQAKEAKILVLDDDRMVLHLLRKLLETWGLQVTVLSEPTGFWQELEATQPDLLILDVQMPDIDGIELCQQLRDHPDWSWLPVVFLTGSRELDTIQRIFSAGADDYVSKPVVAPELIMRVFNRLECTRLLCSQAEIDRLTRLPNRQRSRHQLAQQLSQAVQDQQPFCLAVLELEALKQLNHQYGHAIGDQMLQQVAALLRQEFCPQYPVGRWDGAEFVLGLYGLTSQEGSQWLAEWLTEATAALQALELTHQAVEIRFRSSVAHYPNNGSELEVLYETARTNFAVV